MTAILALDQGTTGSTALVVRSDGQVIGRGYREFTQYFPEPGWVEHDPLELLRVSVEAMREAVAQAGTRPTALGITNQRETVVLWDRRSLEPVARAIVWQDRRTTARCRELREAGLEPMIRRRTGLVCDPYFSATKLEWLLRDPALRAAAERGSIAAGTVESWLVARLTGGLHVSDHTNASRTLLYNLASRAWDDDLLALFSVPRAILPEVVSSAGVLGDVKEEHLGFRLPVAGLAGDQQSALFGQGCTRSGMAKNTYGTGAFLLVHAGDILPEPAAGLLGTAACGPTGEPAYAIEGSVFIAGAAIQWLRDGLGVIATASETEALAMSVSDTAGVTFVPAFVGLGTPHWEPEARGTITGITRGTTRAHLVRAAVESIAHGTTDLLRTVMDSSALEVPVLRVDGGAASNDFLMQFQADLLGVPVERPAMLETTALGAAGLAGIATGVWASVEDLRGSVAVRRFEPAISAAERATHVAAWQRAVHAALAWARYQA